VRVQVLRQAVLAYEAAQRTGTAFTLDRSVIEGSRAKPWRQKGTGRARAGFRRSPIWRGGSVVFGPKPRDYRQRMPRKALQAAKRSAYLAKFLDGEVVVVDELSVERPRTKEVASALAALDIDRSVLIATADHDPVLWKSARNIPRVALKPVAEINAYDLLRSQKLLITRAALDKLVAGLRRKKTPAAAPETPPAAQAPAETAESAAGAEAAEMAGAPAGPAEADTAAPEDE
jgi:large subunit ribosomal protein L4